MDFILNQTQLPSMIVAPEYIPKVLQMKKDGQAGYVKNLISLGESDQQAGCEAAGIKLVQFDISELQESSSCSSLMS